MGILLSILYGSSLEFEILVSEMFEPNCSENRMSSSGELESNVFIHEACSI
jgi:hypothetical protein